MTPGWWDGFITGVLFALAWGAAIGVFLFVPRPGRGPRVKL